MAHVVADVRRPEVGTMIVAALFLAYAIVQVGGAVYLAMIRAGAIE